MSTTHLTIMAHHLYTAIMNNNEEKINTLLSQSSLPRFDEIRPLTYENFQSPLELAIKSPHIFKKLLTIYNDQITPSMKSTLLLQSAAMACLETVNILIEHCQNEISNGCKEILLLSILASSKNTELLAKIMCSNDFSILDTLLQNQNLLDNYAFSIGSLITRLRIFGQESKYSIVKDAYQTLINRLLKIPNIGLIDNIQDGKLDELLTLLKQHGNAISPTYKKAAIETAIEHAQFEIFDLLLTDATFQEIAAWNNNVALMNARNKLNKANSLPMQMLYQKIIDSLMNIPYVAFIESSNNGDIELFKNLHEEHGENISVQDEGYALINAAINNHVEIIEYLLKKSNIHRDDKGIALVLAAEKGNICAIEALLKNISLFTHKIWVEDALLEARMQQKDAEIESQYRYDHVIQMLENFSTSNGLNLEENKENVEPDLDKLEQLFQIYPVTVYAYQRHGMRMNSEPPIPTTEHPHEKKPLQKRNSI